MFLAVLAGLVAIYEGYKWIWETAGLTWPFEVNDRTLPHTWDIVGQLFEPSRRNGPLLIEVLWDAALFTAKEAAVGFALGAVGGFLIAVAPRPLRAFSGAGSCPTSSRRRRCRSWQSPPWSWSGSVGAGSLPGSRCR